MDKADDTARDVAIDLSLMLCGYFSALDRIC